MVIVRVAAAIPGVGWLQGVSFTINGITKTTGELGADFNGRHFPMANTYVAPEGVYLIDGRYFVFDHIEHPFSNVYDYLEIPFPNATTGEFYLWGGHPDIPWPDTVTFQVEMYYIESSPPEIPTTLTIAADRTVINEGESVVFTGVLRRTDTGETIPDMPVTLQVNGQDAMTGYTGAGGVYQASIEFTVAGTYTIAAVFTGYETLSASAAETRVTTGSGASALPLLAAIGAALLITRK